MGECKDPANTIFRAPSDISGINGMHREYIRATPSWRKEGPQYDCIFLNTNSDMEGMYGLEVAHVLAFFSFFFGDKEYQCAHWFLVDWSQIKILVCG